MTELLFFFDTEDFTNEKAAKDARDVAQLLEQEGVCANFSVVGLFARQLRKWGQYGIAAALGQHEIQCHSMGHTYHPDIMEYTDTRDFSDAREMLLRQEGRCLEELYKTFGRRKINAAVPPGDSKSYAAMYVYRELGIPAYADTFVDGSDGGGIYFCGGFHLPYLTAMEDHFHCDGYDEDALVDLLASKRRAILYNHPNCIGYRRFWDELNFKGKNPPDGSYIIPPRIDECLVNRFKSRLIHLVRRVKNDGRFKIARFSDVIADEQVNVSRTVTRDMLPEILRAVRKDDILLDASLAQPVVAFSSLSPKAAFCSGTSGTVNFTLSRAEAFAAAVEFLRGADSYSPGVVRGFLDTPYTTDKPFTATVAQMKAAAHNIDIADFLPEKIAVGQNIAGAADFSSAALELLVNGGESVEIVPAAWDFSLDRWPELRDCNFRGTWMHGDGLRDDYLSRRLKLQAWTLRERTPELYKKTPHI